MAGTPFMLNHPGLLLRAILQFLNLVRSGPELSAKYLAQKCGITERAIEEYFDGTGTLKVKNTDLICSALHLPRREELRLKSLDLSFRNRKRLAQQLENRDPDLHSKESVLRDEIGKLRRLEQPAFIVDPLGFVQAQNELFYRFFGLDLRWQQHPLMWHMVAMKLLLDSPVRMAHAAADDAHRLYDLRRFYDMIEPHLFTSQGLTLLHALHTLFSDIDEFSHLWRSLLVMPPPKSEMGAERLLTYRQMTAKWRFARSKQIKVEIRKGVHLTYDLLAFYPADEKATMIQQHLLAHTKRELVFMPERTVNEFVLAEYAGIAPVALWKSKKRNSQKSNARSWS